MKNSVMLFGSLWDSACESVCNVKSEVSGIRGMDEKRSIVFFCTEKRICCLKRA